MGKVSLLAVFPRLTDKQRRDPKKKTRSKRKGARLVTAAWGKGKTGLSKGVLATSLKGGNKAWENRKEKKNNEEEEAQLWGDQGRRKTSRRQDVQAFWEK